MITLDDYLNYWKVHYPQVQVPDDELTDAMRQNAVEVVNKANNLLTTFGEDRGVASGWRPVEVNRLVPNAARTSNHMTCQAIDIEDHDGMLDDWCCDNVQYLEMHGLYLEHPASTKGWTHIQIVPPRSGKRIFYP